MRNILWLVLALLIAYPRESKAQSVESIKAIFQSHVLNDTAFRHHFVGFALYDPATRRMIYEHNSRRYFTPASNTKLFSLYAGLHLLGDSIPGLRYTLRGDSLIFAGTGDPSLMHPDLSGSTLAFLRSRSEKLFLVPQKADYEALGYGWSWDDYNESYSCERSPLPVHGNFVRVQIPANESVARLSPAYFQSALIADPTLPAEKGRIRRLPWDNRFYLNSLADTTDYQADIPYHWSYATAAALLSDSLGRTVHLLPAFADSLLDRRHYSLHADSLYQPMLQVSDNFFAEQILVMAAREKGISPDSVIHWVLDSLLSGLPDKPVWVDGSGLSRYNLFSPRDLIFLLNRLYKEVPRERLFALLPAGGVSGTIAKWYGSEKGPYVFAKTGTLSNNHNLSGYIVTKSGKVLIFSFMHNHYDLPVSRIRMAMQEVLEDIHKRY
ncbi:MAG: hypothetical protein EAZ89_19525 [Bacteroidetes bacterium]|nr:MAG: hypothetical protein EAZ89_19525 [Bacteroidota bacterium]